jgi:phosphoenolpyruvate carboxykinase (ATP)
MTASSKSASTSVGEIAPGLRSQGHVYWNLRPAALYEHAIRRKEGQISTGGPFNAITAPHTGRSPNDKFVVQEPQTEGDIWWGKVNQPLHREYFETLRKDVLQYLSGQEEIFVRDMFAGADPAYRTSVRFVTTNAWHAMFVYNMFIRPGAGDLPFTDAAFTVLHAPEYQADPARHGTRSSTFVVVNFAEQLVLIGGTRYAGEMKKSMFTALNYVYPKQGILPMHCSANVGPDGDVAIFFGLSGTGKTTLSADSTRGLIGDDEHGWSANGIFNFEGGCYAKIIRLSAEGEPEIHATTQMFGTILENVVLDPESRFTMLEDDSITENTRASYPIHFIPNHVAEGMADHPKHVVFLTADAFGVLPPVARLTPEQAMYHFLSGYTAKVAGTERGVTEPQATFSACFGAPFLPMHPGVYAKMLGEKIATHRAQCWLVNTGWTGGPYGEGHRINLPYTRAMVRAILQGHLDDAPSRPHPIFGVHAVEQVPGVPDAILDPRSTWSDVDRYDTQARKLGEMFQESFARYADGVSNDVRRAGPTI